MRSPIKRPTIEFDNSRSRKDFLFHLAMARFDRHRLTLSSTLCSNIFEMSRNRSRRVCLRQFKRRQAILVACRQQDFVTAVVRDSMRASGVQIKLRDCASKSSASTSILWGEQTAFASQSRIARVEACLETHGSRLEDIQTFVRALENIRSRTRVFLSEDPRTCALGQ
jgi:hypothetical protein